MTILRHKNSFCLHAQTNPFCIKTNLRENRLFAARWALDGEKGTQNVKYITKNQTKQDYVVYARMDNDTEKTYAYYRQCKPLLGMLLTSSGNNIMEKQK